MLSFEGKYKSKKKIRKYVQDVSSVDIVCASREMRREREQLKRQESSSIIIQKVYKSYRTRQYLNRTFLSEFNEKMKEKHLDDKSLNRTISLAIYLHKRSSLSSDHFANLINLLNQRDLVAGYRVFKIVEILSDHLSKLTPKTQSQNFVGILRLMQKIIENIPKGNTISKMLLMSNFFTNMCHFIRNQLVLHDTFDPEDLESLTHLDTANRQRFEGFFKPIQSAFLLVEDASQDEFLSRLLVWYLNSLTSCEAKGPRLNLIIMDLILKTFSQKKVVVRALSSREILVKPNLVFIWLKNGLEYCSREVSDEDGKKAVFLEISQHFFTDLIHLKNIQINLSTGLANHMGGGHLVPFIEFEEERLNLEMIEDFHDQTELVSNEIIDHPFTWKTLFGLLIDRFSMILSHFQSHNSWQTTLVMNVCRVYYMLTYIYQKLTLDDSLRINTYLSRNVSLIKKIFNCFGNLTVSVEQKTDKPTYMSLINAIMENGFPKGTKASEVDDFYAVCSTFCACLRHYLLRMSDEEILEDEGVNGFGADQLIKINQFLLDTSLGIINLSHPMNDIDLDVTNVKLKESHRPKSSIEGPTCALDTEDVYSLINIADFDLVLASGDQSVNGILLSHKQKLDDEIFKNIMSSIEERDKQAEEHDMMDLTSSSDCKKTLYKRIVLHRYCYCFHALQRVVNQIYLWHKRTDQILTPYDDIEKSVSSIWARDNIVDLILAHPEKIISWVSNNSENNSAKNPLSLLAKAPFGYFSRYNTDDNNIEVISYEMINVIRQLIILLHFPFIVKFSVRNQILKALVLDTSVDTRLVDPFFDNSSADSNKIKLRIRRKYIYEDAFESLSRMNAPSLRKQFKVVFVNEHNVEETGYDGGGLSREFISDLITTAFDPIRGLFTLTDSTDFPALYPNPYAAELYDDYLEHYFFLGRILAKGLAMGMLLEIRFSVFFLTKIVSKSSRKVIDFVYLKTLDQELYRNLKFLKNYDGEAGDLDLDFTINVNMFNVKSVDLIPNGSAVRVTNKNRLEYIHRVADYKLNVQMKKQTDAFIAGLADVICIDWLRLYDCFELQTLISGSRARIDIADLKSHVEYSKIEMSQTQTVLDFWNLLQQFSQDDLRALLKFVTGCSSPPMFGFSHLNPPFTIHVVPEIERLPTASTCVNMLKLPDYKDFEKLREKILFVIYSKAGFDYS